MTKRPGSAIVEVLLGISIAALVIVSVGNLVSSVSQADQAAANKTQALAYARESLEIVTAIAQQEFQCTPGGSCTCTPQTGYTKCWQTCPLTSGCGAVYHPTSSSGTWHLVVGTETLGTSPVYTRSLTLAAVGGNSNLKNVTTTVGWIERNRTRTVTETTQVSGWKQ